MNNLFNPNNDLLKHVKLKCGKIISTVLTLIYPISALFFSSIVSVPLIFMLVFISIGTLGFFDKTNPFIQLSLTLISFIGLLLFYIVVVKFIDENNISTLGLRITKNIFKEYIIGFFIGIFMLSIVVFIITLLGDYKINFIGLSLSNIGIFLFALFMWIVQGATEEVMMRGYTLPILSKCINVPVAILISSLYFSLLHLNNNAINTIGLFNLFLSGIFFALYALYSGNLWGVCALHSAWNFAQGNLFGVPVSGITNLGKPIFSSEYTTETLINGGAFGPEGGIIVTFVFIIGILLLIILSNKKKSSC